MVYKNAEFAKYLPDFNAKKPISREYLFNVLCQNSIFKLQIVNSVDPTFFQENISNGYKQRKEHDAEKRARKFEVTKLMYDLIKGSN